MISAFRVRQMCKYEHVHEQNKVMKTISHVLLQCQTIWLHTY